MNRLRLDFGGGSLVALIFLAGAVWWHPAVAVAATAPQPRQEVTPHDSDSPPGQTDVYVVQPGDTLFAISSRFGITVDMLAAANNIDDPAIIDVGQRLIIPPAAEPEQYLHHRVQPGETLHALALRYGLAILELAEPNHLIRADGLFPGQGVTIQEHTDEPAVLRGQSHTVSPTDTLVALAAQHGLHPWALATANNQESPFIAWINSHLWLPGEEGEYLDWPSPFSGVRMHPIPPDQGQTLSIQISLTLPVSITGSFMGAQLPFFQQPGGAGALVGIDALAQTGTHTLVVTATVGDGGYTRYTQQVPIVAGEYSTETIVVSEQVAAIMTPETVQSETALLEQLFAPHSLLQMWDGCFALPAHGDVTSAFGTRRSYNIPDASAYHTGTDFGLSVGTPVHAPADGVVVLSEPLTVRGNAIIIDHGWGVLTGYWHLSASHVIAGDSVVQGQHIGDIGNTGLSTGPHLHWEMRISGVPVDGLQWIREQFP